MDDDIQGRRVKHSLAETNLATKRLAAYRALVELRQAYNDELDSIKADGTHVADLVPFFASLRRTMDALDEEIKTLTKITAHVQNTVIPETYQRDEIRTFTAANGDRVSVSQRTYASILADERPLAHKWLRENGHGDLVTEYVWPGTLSSFAKTWMEDTGMDFPPESHIATELREQASFTAGKKDKS